jgi:phage repressor protein C with HTH and peptisase S24 domain
MFLIGFSVGEKMTFGKRVKSLRKQLGLTQAAFAARIKITKESVQNWEYDRNIPSLPTISTLARTFGVAENWLLTGEGGNKPNSVFSIPYYTSSNSELQKPNGSFDINSAMFNLSSESGIIILYVKGDAMHPYIKDGDGILVNLNEKTITAEATYAIRWRGALLVKDVRLAAGGVKLVSKNPAYEPIILTGDAVNEIQIVGRILGSFRTY